MSMSNRVTPEPTAATEEPAGNLELLYRLASVALQPLPLEAALQETLRILVEGLHADTGEVWLRDTEADTLRLAAVHPHNAPVQERREFRVGEGVVGLAASERIPMSVDIRADARFLRRAMVAAGYTYYRAVPMLTGGALPGVLCVAYRDPPPGDVNHQRLVARVAHDLGLIIVNDSLRREHEAARGLLEGLVVRDVVARELQEHVMQALFSVELALHASGAEDRLDRAAFEKALGDLRSVLRDVRSLVVQLEQEPRTFLSARGLRSRLESLLGAGTRDPAWQLEFDLGDVRLDPKVEVELYLLVRELVANVYAHAAATLASVTLRRESGRIVLVVRDNGVGFDSDAALDRAVGLRNVQRRVAALGGALEIDTAPGAGASVSCWLPSVSRGGTLGANVSSAAAELSRT